jgi:hypothetical protein
MEGVKKIIIRAGDYYQPGQFTSPDKEKRIKIKKELNNEYQFSLSEYNE